MEVAKGRKKLNRQQNSIMPNRPIHKRKDFGQMNNMGGKNLKMWII
ncbi:MAG: hypothetical protein QXT13_08040 [Pyrobaculum sp.]